MAIGHEEAVFALFDRLRELPHAARESALDAEPGLTEAVRREVLSLLAFDRPTGEVFGDLAQDVTATLWAGAEIEPKTIGPYRVVRLLGRGGFGRVYLCEETHPKRLVAVKIMRPLHGPDEARRFEFEAQVLATLNHPGIARVYACGVDAALGGLPYIAMEYVDGPTIDVAVRSGEVDHAGRLRLLVQLCRAVASAHQRGVLHRDLSTKNILVDESGRPKLIDFGLSRPVSREAMALSRHTADGAMLGTLHAMSPEQLAGGSRVADARSDVYALGLVCWQIVTGKHPFAPDDASLSTLLSSLLSAPLPRAVGAHKMVRGDLRLVLAKALERDPKRRYQSAGELADDLQAVLERKPVRAHAPSVGYLLRHLAGRHKPLAAAAAVGLVALVALGITLGVSARRELVARGAAINALDAVVSRVLGPMAPKLGTLEEREALLRSIEPDIARVLASGSHEPQVVHLEARFAGAMGDVLRERGRHAEALSHQQRAVAAMARLHNLTDERVDIGHEYSIAIVKLGDTLKEVQGLDAAFEAYERALELDTHLLRRTPEDLGVLSNLFWSLTRFEDREITTQAGDGASWREREAAVARTMMQIDSISWRSLEATIYAEYRVGQADQLSLDAVVHFEAAMEAAATLVRVDPSVARHQSTLVFMATRLAGLALDHGVVDTARHAFATCAAAVQTMRDSSPTEADEYTYIGPHDYHLARLRHIEGRHAEAIDLLDRRMQYLQPMIDRGVREEELLLFVGETHRLALYCAAAMGDERGEARRRDVLMHHLALCESQPGTSTKLREHMDVWRRELAQPINEAFGFSGGDGSGRSGTD